jgi:hypothetical protein
MGKNFLDSDGQERLKKVLEYANNDLSRVHHGIVYALKDINERGRRIYLWNQLCTRAERTIKARLKKAAGQSSASHVETPLRSLHEAYLDAFRHEQRILSGISEEDR